MLRFASFFVLILVLISCESTSSETAASNSTDSISAESTEDSVSLVQDTNEREPEPAFQSVEDWPRDEQPLTLQSHRIKLQSGDTFDLQAPAGWKISPVREDFGRLRFISRSPDGRLFATDMKNRSDNSKGKVYVLDGFDPLAGTFDSVYVYLSGLRNPNNLTFHTDTNGHHWLYLALTDELRRYPFTKGETSPSSEPEVVATFPDYGLSYKYGGWHLTRTVAIHDEKVYVSVGSSCNVCEEEEPVRASILEMELDGANSQHFAYGVRNAVGMKWVHGRLFTTNMGADHLGDEAPEEALYQIERGKNYGWPWYYEWNGEILADTSFEWTYDTLAAEDVPLAYAALGGHSAPLGFSFFDHHHWPPALKNYFVVALHGSGWVRVGSGYQLVRAAKGRKPEPIIDGWLQNGHRYGRPCDVFIYNDRSFFVTDDHAGVLYYVEVD